MAEITAAPAAEIALSPKPKFTSVKLLECETATFLSYSTVVLAAVVAEPIHEGNPCFVDDDPTIKKNNCIFSGWNQSKFLICVILKVKNLNFLV